MNKKTQFLEFICTWLYSGKAKFAPGTFGSLATLPFVYLISTYFGPIGIFIFALITFVIGIIACDKYTKIIDKQDPGFIVIDEVSGQSIALLLAGTNIYLYIIGFILFRIFDILKPYPVSWADKKLHGGFGIMLDDIFAGIYALIILEIIKSFI